MAQNEYEFLKTGNHEYIKSYVIYDGSNRITNVYEARANALNGEYCLLTTYSYVGATNLIQKSHEQGATWDSTWD